MVTEIEILPSGEVRLQSFSGRKIRLSSVFLTNRKNPLFSFIVFFPGSSFFIETRPSLAISDQLLNYQLVTYLLPRANQPFRRKYLNYFYCWKPVIYKYNYNRSFCTKLSSWARSRLWQRSSTQGNQALTSLLAHTVGHAISSTPWWLSPDTRAILHHPLFSSSFFRDEGRPPEAKRKTASSSRRTPIRTFFSGMPEFSDVNWLLTPFFLTFKKNERRSS